ncbi:MAG: phosphoribosylformylglycinamidine cyclo-ligase [Candidatus Lokiarchaeota archaeon]|nr:phosphoribosylformylglycinamidine cyclo-ligase [Candidatus Lokiarchaeota archaeon]
MSKKYEELGVSSSKNEVYQALKFHNKGIYPTAFCKINEDVLGNDPKFCNIMHADGAGTKTSLAYICYKETNNLNAFRGIVHDAVVMNLDDIACVGIIDNLILSNTIGRNKKLITGEILEVIFDEFYKFINKLQSMEINIQLSGGETADVGDLVRTLILDSTIIARGKKDDVIKNEKINNNDVIIGFASFGKCSYESTYNSGIGSNGLTLARHGTLKKKYQKLYPESFDPLINSDLVYYGMHDLLEKIPSIGLTIGEALLSPTRTYLPVLKEIFKTYRKKISALIHCTGGGQTKCLKTGKNIHYIKDNLFKTPEIFNIIQESSKTPWREMYQVFNMGHRLELICEESIAEKIIQISKKFEIPAKKIGRCESSTLNALTIKTEYGSFEYK